MKHVRHIAKILVRPPSPNLNLGLVSSHMERRPVDAKLAMQQWVSYVDALQRYSKCEVIEVPTADHLPDGVFVEDAAVWINHHNDEAYASPSPSQRLAIITNPGNDARKPECASVEAALQSAVASSTCMLQIQRIQAPGTLDGGDVLQLPGQNTILVGLSARTNAAGIAQLRALTSFTGVSVQAISVGRVLHLKSGMTALPGGELIVWGEAFQKRMRLQLPLRHKCTWMPEESGAHVVLLDDKTVLMAQSAPKSADILRARGYTVYTVDISEFEKLEGCVTCLSIRVRQD